MNRNGLKRQIFEAQGWSCWVEGCPYPAIHLHESLITKGDVQGCSNAMKKAINHEYNCIGLCHKHHKYAPRAIDVFSKMCDDFGQGSVIDWLLSFDFVNRPMDVKEILISVGIDPNVIRQTQNFPLTH